MVLLRCIITAVFNLSFHVFYDHFPRYSLEILLHPFFVFVALSHTVKFLQYMPKPRKDREPVAFLCRQRVALKAQLLQ